MITQKDKRWMNLAGKILKYSTHPKQLMSCVIIRGGAVISTGINKTAAPKRFTRPHRKNLHLHAEIDSLIAVDRSKFKGATAYINGETVSGTSLLSKPCQTCEDFLRKMGIKRIVYNDRDTIRELK